MDLYGGVNSRVTAGTRYVIKKINNTDSETGEPMNTKGPDKSEIDPDATRISPSRVVVVFRLSIDPVDFNEVLEKDINSLRKSVDETKTFFQNLSGLIDEKTLLSCPYLGL